MERDKTSYHEQIKRGRKRKEEVTDERETKYMEGGKTHIPDKSMGKSSNSMGK